MWTWQNLQTKRLLFAFEDGAKIFAPAESVRKSWEVTDLNRRGRELLENSRVYFPRPNPYQRQIVDNSSVHIRRGRDSRYKANWMTMHSKSRKSKDDWILKIKLARCWQNYLKSVKSSWNWMYVNFSQPTSPTKEKVTRSIRWQYSVVTISLTINSGA